MTTNNAHVIIFYCYGLSYYYILLNISHQSEIQNAFFNNDSNMNFHEINFIQKLNDEKRSTSTIGQFFKLTVYYSIIKWLFNVNIWSHIFRNTNNSQNNWINRKWNAENKCEWTFTNLKFKTWNSIDFLLDFVIKIPLIQNKVCFFFYITSK